MFFQRSRASLCHAVAADGGGVLLPGRENVASMLCTSVGQPLRLGNQAFSRGEASERSAVDDIAEVEIRQVARLVHQHLRFVLELVDLC